MLYRCVVVLLSISTLVACGQGPGGSSAVPIDLTSENRAYFLPYSVGAGGVFLVNAADFNDVLRVESRVIGHPHTIHSTSSSAGTWRASPHALVYTAEGAWYRLWLGSDRPRTPVRIAGGGQNVCYSQIYYSNVSDPDSVLLIYLSAGPNAICNDTYDAYYFVSLTGGPDQDATPLTGIPLSPIHDSAGRLTAILMVDQSALLLFEYPAGSVRTIGSTLDGALLPMARVPGGVWLLMGNEARRITLSGISAPRHTIPEGFGIVAAPHADATNVYFVEVDLESATRTPSRLWRLRLDDSAPAELVQEISDETLGFSALTHGRLWVEASSGQPQVLRWHEKGSETGTNVAEEIGGGAIAFYAAESRLAYNLQDVSTGMFSVKVASDDGSVTSLSANGQMQGAVSTMPDVLSADGNAPFTHVILVDGGDTTNVSQSYVGSRLVSYDLQTLAAVPLRQVDRDISFHVFGHGLAGLGSIRYPGSGCLDVFAYDVENGRYKTVTETPTQCEVPLY